MTKMTRMRTLFALLLSASPALAQESAPLPSEPLEQRSQRLGETLTHLAASDHWSAGDTALNLGFGAAIIGVGTYFAFSHEPQEGQGTSRGFAVALSVLGGASLFARGVYALGGVTTEGEKRLARFNRDRSAGTLNELEMARFEAQIELEASQAKTRRRWSAVNNIGIAAAGAGLMTLGATSRLRGPARDVMYYEGGGLFAVGTAFAIYDFCRESSAEREWRSYRAATPTTSPANVTFQFAPVLGPQLAALSLVGRF